MFVTQAAGNGGGAVGSGGGRGGGSPALPPEAVGRPPTVGFDLSAARKGRSGGARAPCISFFLILFLPTPLMIFVYQRLPLISLVTVALLFLISLASLGNVGGSRLSAILLAGVILSTANGLHGYYAHTMPLSALRTGRSYTNVFPQEPAVAFSDASMIRFAGNVSADDSKALGLTSFDGGINTFCVGPVVDLSSVGRVEFWAVGVNCCGGKLGNFQCDSGGEAGGVVVPSPLEGDILYWSVGKFFAPPEARRELFLEAVSAAEKVNEVASSEYSVLVRWETRSRSALLTAHSLAIAGFIALSLASSAGAAVGLVTLGYRESVARLLRSSLCGSRSRGWRAGSKFESIPLSTLEVSLLGFVIPLLTLILTVVIFSWAPCLSKGAVLVWLLVAMLLVAAITLMMARRSFVFGIVLLMAAAAGSFTGQWNYYRHTFHYCAAGSYQVYSDVPADADVAQYSDAGKVWFASDAAIGEGQALGFLYRGERHCVAPILPKSCVGEGGGGVQAADGGNNLSASAAPLSSPETVIVFNRGNRIFNDPAPVAAESSSGTATACPELQHADFWAVGTDCCDWRKSFNCFASGQQQARAGMVIRDTIEEGVFDQELAGYYLAVRAAADLYGLPAPARPLLVSWGSDPEALRGEWATSSVRVLVLSTVLAFFALALVANGGLHVYGRKSDSSGGRGRRQQDGSSPYSPSEQSPDNFFGGGGGGGGGGQGGAYTPGAGGGGYGGGAGYDPQDFGSPGGPQLPQPRSRRRK